MNKYKELIKNIGLLTVSNFGSKILSFLLVPLYTAKLTTEQYGSYDYIYTTISLLIPILKINISKESKIAIKVDLPGAEELDKAITEHQELVQEENFMQGIIGEKNTHINEDEQNYIEEIAINKFEVEDFDEKPKRRGRHF